MFHISLHFIVPALIAALFFRKNYVFAFFVMAATIVVDIDHVFATHIYDASRCSIGFHPLHKLGFIAIYAVLCFFSRFRLIGLGLSIHMLLDAIDCQVTNGVWLN